MKTDSVLSLLYVLHHGQDSRQTTYFAVLPPATTISSALALKAKYRLAAKHNSIFKLHSLLYSIDFFSLLIPMYSTFLHIPSAFIKGVPYLHKICLLFRLKSLFFKRFWAFLLFWTSFWWYDGIFFVKKYFIEFRIWIPLFSSPCVVFFVSGGTMRSNSLPIRILIHMDQRFEKLLSKLSVSIWFKF